MNSELLDFINQYVQTHIGDFHRDRLGKLESLKLRDLLTRKNPYLFRAKDIQSGPELVESLASAYMSSAEETIFGGWLEKLAIAVAKFKYRGWKSAAPGIDLEFDRVNPVTGRLTRYAVSIKSGPNWSNKSSLDKLRDNFKSFKKRFTTQNSQAPCICVEGCCYGKKKTRLDEAHSFYCGQAFWKFISGEGDLYKEIIEPLGANAHSMNLAYQQAYANMINQLTKAVLGQFMLQDGSLDWHKIIEFNSEQP